MAKAVVIAQSGKLVGVFTTINFAWKALCMLEGTEDIESCLILADKRPSAKCEAVSLNYARLCAMLRDTKKADIRTGGGDTPAPIKYALWLTSLNEMLNKENDKVEHIEKDDVCEPAVPQDVEESGEDDQYQNLALFDRTVAAK